MDPIFGKILTYNHPVGFDKTIPIQYYFISPEHISLHYYIVVKKSHVRKSIRLVVPFVISIFFYKSYVVLVMQAGKEQIIKALLDHDYENTMMRVQDCINFLDSLDESEPSCILFLHEEPFKFPHEAPEDSISPKKSNEDFFSSYWKNATGKKPLSSVLDRPTQDVEDHYKKMDLENKANVPVFVHNDDNDDDSYVYDDDEELKKLLQRAKNESVDHCREPLYCSGRNPTGVPSHPKKVGQKNLFEDPRDDYPLATQALTQIPQSERPKKTCSPKNTYAGFGQREEMTPTKFFLNEKSFNIMYNGLQVKYYQNDPRRYTNFNYAIIEGPHTLQTLYDRKQANKHFFYSYVVIDDQIVSIPLNTVDPVALNVYASCDVTLGFAETFQMCIDMILMRDDKLKDIQETYNKKIDNEMSEIQKFYEKCKNVKKGTESDGDSFEEELYNDDAAIIDNDYEGTNLPSYFFEFNDPNKIFNFHFVSILTEKDILFFLDYFTESMICSIVSNDENMIFISQQDNYTNITNMLKKIIDPEIVTVSGIAKDYSECIEKILLDK
jgi:hypothetical protein